VRVASGDVSLAGTLLIPQGSGPHPAVLFLHGSGPQTRDSPHRFLADFFARRGFASLIYDKRGTGASTGVPWERSGDRFDDLAADALAGVRMLSRRPEINPRQIGLWGHSQGAWLAPLAASRSQQVAFVILLSGGGVTPAEQELYDDEVKLRDHGFSEAQVAEALALLKGADDYARTGAGWDRFQAALQAARGKPWFPEIDRFPLLLPEAAPPWRGWRAILDFDPRPVLRRLRVPVLAIYGESDQLTPARESVRRVAMALKTGGNRDVTIRILPGADHGLWVAPKPGARWDWDRPAPGWLDGMVDWLRRRLAMNRTMHPATARWRRRPWPTGG
jgi:uncharacterized protein